MNVAEIHLQDHFASVIVQMVGDLRFQLAQADLDTLEKVKEVMSEPRFMLDTNRSLYDGKEFPDSAIIANVLVTKLLDSVEDFIQEETENEIHMAGGGYRGEEA